MKRYFTWTNSVVSVFFLFVAYLYISHITHDVYSGDIGDLATAAYFFGVPHPPGYPTVTLLGFLFSRLPLALPIISRISLVSTSAAIIGLILFYTYAKAQTKSVFLSLFATSLLAFSYLYWLYAEIPEVFAISNCLLIGIYYCAWQFFAQKKLKYLYWTAFLVGLSLTDQQAILAAFPGLLVFILPRWNVLWKRKSVFLKAIGFGLLGLIPYLYLPIAAATHPQINWMKEPTVTNFFRMLTRADYEFAKNLVGLDQRFAVLRIYWSALLENYSILGVVIEVIGVIRAYKVHKTLWAALLIGFILCGPLFIFVITPGITDQDELGVLERFFMHSFVLFAFFLPFGLQCVHRLFTGLMARVIPEKKHRQQLYATVFLLPFLVIPLQMIRYSGQKTNLSQTTIGYQLAADILSPLPKNAVVILNSDTPTFNSWYSHFVLGLRPDVTLVSGGGERNNFKNDLLARYKGPLKRKAYNTKIDNTILAAMLPEVLKTRPVFSTDIIAIPTPGYAWVPRGLTYQLMPLARVPSENEFVNLAQKDLYRLHTPYRERLKPSEQNLITPNIPRLYSYGVLAMGDAFYVSYGNPKRAMSYYRFAQIIDPDNSVIYAKMGIAQAELPNGCRDALENLETAIQLYRIYKPYYTFTLRVYQACKVPKEKIANLKAHYKAFFGKELEKDLHY